LITAPTERAWDVDEKAVETYSRKGGTKYNKLHGWYQSEQFAV